MLPLKNKHFIFIPIPKHNKLRQLLQKIFICLPLVPTTSYPKYIYLSALGSNYIYLILNIFICLPLVPMTSYPKYMYLSPLGSNYIYLIPNIFICLPLVSTISYPPLCTSDQGSWISRSCAAGSWRRACVCTSPDDFPS